jgi:hypothetical protein
MDSQLPQPTPRSLDAVFESLSQSRFRSGFHILSREKEYLAGKGLTATLSHARVFIGQRLAPAQPKNDGKQTPWRGHPVFIAQHATGTCCRGCLAKWHGIPRGVMLDAAAQDHIIAVIERWLKNELEA